MSHVFTVEVHLVSSNVTYLIIAAFRRRRKTVNFPRTINESNKVFLFCFGFFF